MLIGEEIFEFVSLCINVIRYVHNKKYMRNWDYPKVRKTRANKTWWLERLLTHGLGCTRIRKAELKRALPRLHIPDDTRAFLELLIWKKKKF